MRSTLVSPTAIRSIVGTVIIISRGIRIHLSWLQFEVTQSLFVAMCNSRILAMKLLFRQLLHHLLPWYFSIYVHDTKSFTLSIRSILEELDISNVRNSETIQCISNVLICSPPSQITNVQSETSFRSPIRTQSYWTSRMSAFLMITFRSFPIIVLALFAVPSITRPSIGRC